MLFPGGRPLDILWSEPPGSGPLEGRGGPWVGSLSGIPLIVVRFRGASSGGPLLEVHLRPSPIVGPLEVVTWSGPIEGFPGKVP
jgi:hypothetical protein